jgi:guanylate kinase
MVGPNIITVVGEAGTGKTTLIKSLVHSDETFRVLTSVTTRNPRSTDLPNEYRHLRLQEYEKLASIPNRFLWNVIAGSSDRYAKDILDVMDAVLDPEHIYMQALVPESARILAQRYGSKVVQTVFLQRPDKDELVRRMLQRGDKIDTIGPRLDREFKEDWMGQVADIEGLVVITNQDLVVRHNEVKTLAHLTIA